MSGLTLWYFLLSLLSPLAPLSIYAKTSENFLRISTMKTLILISLLATSLSLFAQDELIDSIQDACRQAALEKVERIVAKPSSKRENRIVDAQVDIAFEDLDQPSPNIKIEAQVFTYIVDGQGRELNGQYAYPGSYNRESGICSLNKGEFHDWWCDGGLFGFLSSVRCLQ